MSESSDVLDGSAVEPSSAATRRMKAFSKAVPPYALLFFDHLYSEYLALQQFITEAEVRELFEGLREKRLKYQLTWSDIYTFDLTLVRFRPLENLIRKAYDARAKYRSIAGQKEYDEYVASKPPNLPEILVDPKADPPQPEEIIERALRADLEYLLSKVYLYYAILPVRERLRDWLTNRAVVITLVAVLIIGLLIFSNLFLNLIVAIKGTPEKGFFGAVVPALNEMSVVLVTVLTVALAGIVGGCVSMLQRIQSAPSEGDALFNLAALNNGWKGIFLSPLYGGIFAALLFVLFAAGLLEGSAFPRISTPRRQIGPQAAAVRPTPHLHLRLHRLFHRLLRRPRQRRRLKHACARPQLLHPFQRPFNHLHQMQASSKRQSRRRGILPLVRLRRSRREPSHPHLHRLRLRLPPRRLLPDCRHPRFWEYRNF